MRRFVAPDRRVMIGAALAALVVVTVLGLAAVGTDGAAPRHGRTSGTEADPAGPSPAGGVGLDWRTAVTAAAPDTPIQRHTDQALLEGVGRVPGMEAAVALPVPAPAVSGGWPDLPVEHTPEAWARRFVEGLLDVDYAAMSRDALGPWLQAHEAPALIPGVPEPVADKMLYTSLLATEVFGGQPTPVPSPAEWEANARARAEQRVTDLRVQVSPRWAQLVAAGWQPPDARMTILDVTGLRTHRRGDAVTIDRFGLQLLVGSARWRAGYGTVSVSGWGVGPE